MTKFEICKEFREGAAAQIGGQAFDTGRSIHWRAGWNAGYALQNQLSDALNKHLRLQGLEAVGIVGLAKK
ncbi:MAG TPA: hypothetical protein PKO33_00090 [Pyrinomonadaceae bacterium]|nr:hypothetical protein [Pyrinomonadaceae bacterium]